LETCNKRLACRKYNSTFESRLFLKVLMLNLHVFRYKSYASHECRYYWNYSQKSSTNYHFLQTHLIAHGEKTSCNDLFHLIIITKMKQSILAVSNHEKKSSAWLLA
ncbi:hypothetical protein T08_9392, partial [Trichinella sp. T8]